MSYLKLCQLVSQTTPDKQGIDTVIIYQEDCNGSILVSNQTYPLVLYCEIIDWSSEQDFQERRLLNPSNSQAFQSISVTLSVVPIIPQTIRQTVFAQLQVQFPSLII